MPIFEYACDKCGFEFEEITHGDVAPSCPKCGAAETRKLMSASARRPRGGDGDYCAAPSGGGCGGCTGGNCASCCH